MAKEKSTSKRAKIDKAQRNMFVAVCLASVVVAATIVTSLWFVKKIKFNNKYMEQQKIVINDLETSQQNLATLVDEIDKLKTNEPLEAVARGKETKSQSEQLKTLCEKFLSGEYDKSKDSSDSSNNKNDSGDKTEEATSDNNEYQLARTCSALRIIPDALPSGRNEVATFGSLDLLTTNVVNVGSLGPADYYGDYDGYSEEDEVVTSSIDTIGAHVGMTDDATHISNALNRIENSIRNYDIRSANIKWSDDTRSGEGIEFSATFSAYYSNPVNIELKKRNICADSTNKVCGEKGGDESL